MDRVENTVRRGRQARLPLGHLVDSRYQPLTNGTVRSETEIPTWLVWLIRENRARHN